MSKTGGTTHSDRQAREMSIVIPATAVPSQSPALVSSNEDADLSAAFRPLFRELSKELEVTINTVKFHLSNLYEKLGVKNRAQAIAFFYSSRLALEQNSDDGIPK